MRPERPDPFQPNNKLLEVTPGFLALVVEILRQADVDLVSLDEMYQRVRARLARRFACFTFDDGYRDNKIFAYPVLKRLDLPFAIYVPTSYRAPRRIVVAGVGSRDRIDQRSVAADGWRSSDVRVQLSGRQQQFAACRTTKRSGCVYAISPSDMASICHRRMTLYA